MNNPPIYYDYANSQISQISPNTVHSSDTTTTRYFEKYLLQKIMSVFKWTLPTEWPIDYFLYVLYCEGFLAVLDYSHYGVICQQCSLSGYDIYYRPTRAKFYFPKEIETFSRKIGVDCSIIKLQPNYSGVMDIVYHYANQLSLLTSAINVTALNTKNSFVFAAGNKQIAESIKKMYDSFASGQPATVVDKKLFDDKTGRLQLDLLGSGGQHIEINDLLLALHTIENNFNNDIGLPVLPATRKERDIAAEVTQNIKASNSKLELWMDNIQACLKDVNDMFNINLKCEWRSSNESAT